MHRWSDTQLFDTAEKAIARGHYQDAVTVLAYLIQNYPDSEMVAVAREKYRFLTGVDYEPAIVTTPATQEVSEVAAGQGQGEGDGQAGVVSDVTGNPSPPEEPSTSLNGAAASQSLQAALAKVPGPDDQDGASKPASEAGDDRKESVKANQARQDKKEPLAAKEKSFDASSPKQAADEAAPSVAAIAMAESGSAGRELQNQGLQSNDWAGRIIADLFYALGWGMLPVAVLLLIFSFAFKSLLLPAIPMLALSPVLIGAGQTMWAIFETRRLTLANGPGTTKRP